MKTNYSDLEPDLKSDAEARFISAQTRIQDEREAAELGMTTEQYYKERDEMINDSYSNQIF
jgi:uncharacterized membrane protein